MDDNEKAVVQKAVRAMDAAAKEIDKLTAENQSLAARVEVLRISALNAIQSMAGGKAKADLRDAYDATPAACLAQVRAEAVEKAANELGALITAPAGMYSGAVEKLNRIADSIRQGGAQ